MSDAWRPVVCVVLKAVAIVCRVAAWLLVALVAVDCFATGSTRAELLSVNAQVTSWIPAALSGLFVIATPFGGAFRGDFALAAVILLVLDWALCRASVSLR